MARAVSFPRPSPVKSCYLFDRIRVIVQGRLQHDYTIGTSSSVRPGWTRKVQGKTVGVKNYASCRQKLLRPVTAGKNSTSHSSDRTIPEAKKFMGRGTFMFFMFWNAHFCLSNWRWLRLHQAPWAEEAAAGGGLRVLLIWPTRARDCSSCYTSSMFPAIRTI